jgi:hypothetical protein
MIMFFAGEYLLSQHFPEIQLLENVRFTLFSVSITNTFLGNAKPWLRPISMDFCCLSVSDHVG